MLFFETYEMELTPPMVIVGDSSKRKFLKKISVGKNPIRFMYGKIKNIFPYGERFSTENAEIVEYKEAFYQIGKITYAYFKGRLRKVAFKVVNKEEVKTPRYCKYKMYLTTFYDVVTQDVFTKYLVEA